MSFAYVWSFEVPEASRARFEAAYASGGDWAKLFRQADGYIRTDLLMDVGRRGRYLTVDHWTSSEALRRFREDFDRQYRDLDREFDGLASREVNLGDFEVL